MSPSSTTRTEISATQGGTGLKLRGIQLPFVSAFASRETARPRAVPQGGGEALPLPFAPSASARRGSGAHPPRRVSPRLPAQPPTPPLRRLRLLPEAPRPLPSRSPRPAGSRGSPTRPQVRAPLGPARWKRPRRARRADGTPRAPGRDWPGGEGRRAEKMAPPPAAALS